MLIPSNLENKISASTFWKQQLTLRKYRLAVYQKGKGHPCFIRVRKFRRLKTPFVVITSLPKDTADLSSCRWQKKKIFIANKESSSSWHSWEMSFDLILLPRYKYISFHVKTLENSVATEEAPDVWIFFHQHRLHSPHDELSWESNKSTSGINERNLCMFDETTSKPVIKQDGDQYWSRNKTLNEVKTIETTCS